MEDKRLASLTKLSKLWRDRKRRDSVSWTKNVLSLYSTERYGTGKSGLPAFLSDATERAVFDSLRDGNTMEEIERDATLVLAAPAPGRVEPTEAEVLESLMLRYPIYFGRPLYGNYDAGRLSDVLGYDLSDLPYHPGLRFALVAPCKTVWGDRFFSIHAWGVNLESCETTDYSIHVDRTSGRLKLDTYDIEQKRIAGLLRDSLDVVASKTNRPCHFLFPGMGMGFFLSSLTSEEDRVAARTSFLKNLELALVGIDTQTVKGVELCLSGAFRDPSWRKALESANPRNFEVSSGDLFDLSRVPEDRLPVVLNSWDDRSFVGNGGSGDNSVDGWYVAGTGPGAKMTNVSFLHNPFICTSFLDPLRWVRSREANSLVAVPLARRLKPTLGFSSNPGDCGLREAAAREKSRVDARRRTTELFSDRTKIERTGLRVPLSLLAREIESSKDPFLKSAFRCFADSNDGAAIGLYTNQEGSTIALTLGSVARALFAEYLNS